MIKGNYTIFGINNTGNEFFRNIVFRNGNRITVGGLYTAYQNYRVSRIQIQFFRKFIIRRYPLYVHCGDPNLVSGFFERFGNGCNAIQALGYPIFSTVNALAWVLGFRYFWMSVIYPMYNSYASLIYCFGVSYVLTFICNVVIFAVLYTRYRKGKYKRI